MAGTFSFGALKDASPAAIHQFVEEEQRRFDAEVAEVETWWASGRFALTNRPYTARDVVRLRDSLPKMYPSGMQAKK
ncbi:unnamed protein product, partial [Closterium sp. NIES-53]